MDMGDGGAGARRTEALSAISFGVMGKYGVDPGRVRLPVTAQVIRTFSERSDAFNGPRDLGMYDYRTIVLYTK